MTLLPNEILVKIFQYLPLYSQHQCLQVCRSWNTISRALANDETQKVGLYGASSISNLIREISLNSARGLSIRQVYFFSHDDANDDDSMRSELLCRLLKRCPNIAELVFGDGSQPTYIGCLLGCNVDLPKLEVIRFRSYALYPGHLKDRTDLLFKRRKTLNQLCISINLRDLSNSQMHYIENYLQTFTNLKCLSLATSCPVLFDALIKACPQMQILKLTLYHGTSFQVMQNSKACGRGNSLLTEFPDSQLEILEINHDLMTADLYIYIRCCCHYLSQLVLFIDYRKSIGPLLDTFEFYRANTLPLTTISINGNLSGANRLAQGLYKWLPSVNQVDAGCFDQEGAYRNFAVDMDQKNLLCLSINITPTSVNKLGFVERVALEIITENATVWYQREGKWDADTQFVLEDNEQYTNASAREIRMISYKTAVISIEAESIQILYVYFRSHQNSFAQVIHLNQ